MDRIQIMVVDDHPIVRQGIRSLLSNYPEFEIVGEADHGASAIAQISRLAPDITLLDIRMPGESGLEVLKQIRQIQPEAKVLMLTSFDDDEYVMEALRTGAYGFVLKSVSDEMLINAIRAVQQGHHVLGPQVTGSVVQRAISDRPESAETGTEFDEDEQQILRLIVAGATNSQIAADLYMSHTSVKRKLRTIFAKLDVQTRTEAAAEAVRRGLI
jgi:DNA-binding NarL/FixJ family response regulator